MPSCISPSPNYQVTTPELTKLDSVEQIWTLIPDSLMLARNRVNITENLADTVLDVSTLEGVKSLTFLIRDFVQDNLIYPEDEYKSNFEEDVVMYLHYDSCGYIYNVTPISFPNNLALIKETTRLIHLIPKLPVKEPGRVGILFEFNIQKYDIIQKTKLGNDNNP